MLCAETVVVALNHGFSGGLTEKQTIAVAAPFSMAMGESGCLCGALSGAVMACGLLLGNDQAYRHRRDMRESARALHDAFKATYGSTCCRVLSQKVRLDKKARFEQCADVTATTVELAARLVLAKRPGLIKQADSQYLDKKESTIVGALLRLVHHFSR